MSKGTSKDRDLRIELASLCVIISRQASLHKIGLSADDVHQHSSVEGDYGSTCSYLKYNNPNIL